MAMKTIFLAVFLLAIVHEPVYATIDDDCTNDATVCDTAAEICLVDPLDATKKKCASNACGTSDCKHGGACGANSKLPCDCSATGGYTGPKCETDPPAAKCTPACTGSQTCDTTASPPTCRDQPAATCTPACTGSKTCDTTASPPVCKDNGGNSVAAVPGILLALLLAAIYL